jgi:hypothetical protein
MKLQVGVMLMTISVFSIADFKSQADRKLLEPRAKLRCDANLMHSAAWPIFLRGPRAY